MKRYKIVFEEYSAIKKRFVTVSEEDYDKLTDAKAKFFLVIALAQHSVNHVSYVLKDMKTDMHPEIMKFTYIVQE
jgi:hypothetical protein